MRVLVIEKTSSSHDGGKVIVDVSKDRIKNHGFQHDIHGSVNFTIGSGGGDMDKLILQSTKIIGEHEEKKRTDDNIFDQIDMCKGIVCKNVCLGLSLSDNNLKTIKAVDSALTLNGNSLTKKHMIMLNVVRSYITIACSNRFFRLKLMGIDHDSKINIMSWDSIHITDLAISPELPSRAFVDQTTFFHQRFAMSIMQRGFFSNTSESWKVIYRKNMNMPSTTGSSRNSNKPASSRPKGRQISSPSYLCKYKPVVPSTSFSTSSVTMPIIDLTQEVPILKQKSTVPEFAIKQDIGDDKYVACVTCETYAATVLFSPCSHHVLCPDCYEMMEKTSKNNSLDVKCPMCKVTVYDKLFTAPYSVQREIKNAEPILN